MRATRALCVWRFCSQPRCGRELLKLLFSELEADMKLDSIQIQDSRRLRNAQGKKSVRVLKQEIIAQWKGTHQKFFTRSNSIIRS